MNTFATLLLAFPFYLAIKGKLAGYVALAKPGASSGAASSQTSNSDASQNTTTQAPKLADTVQSVAHIFGDVAAMASV